ncbi:hypothetical protein MES4922_10111 [Mesorhizobium ventifaucium]|uniref:Uncharacterized protein n=1 Tax=Mesorhizobium ventifaucium TaxID=666020 RepID=A0ABM9DDN1_9HYPH|nr:hypothetical protein MES4922_10111 [Mesorhizobium ventifaucium]
MVGTFAVPGANLGFAGWIAETTMPPAALHQSLWIRPNLAAKSVAFWSIGDKGRPIGAALGSNASMPSSLGSGLPTCVPPYAFRQALLFARS